MTNKDIETTPDREAAVAEILRAPLHAALGIVLVDPDHPEAGITMPVSGLALSGRGALHGGIVYAMLDVAVYLALLTQMPPGASAVTHSLSASLIASVAPRETLHVRGRIDRLGRSLAFCTSEAHHGSRLVASAQIVKSVRYSEKPPSTTRT